MENELDPEIPQEPEKEEPAVIVDLSEKPKEEKKEEPKWASQEEVKKLHNTVAFQSRQLERATKEMQSLVDQLRKDGGASKPAPKSEEEMDELDKIAQTDWKEAVRRLGKEEAKKLFDEVKKNELDEQAKLARHAQLELSKTKALKRYPTLADETSEEARLYEQVVTEDPSLLQEPKGPEIAMYRMEEKMRELGKTPPVYRETVDKEVQRRARIGAGTLPAGRRSAGENKVPLTKDQIEYCKHHNIPYDVYAKTVRSLESGESLEA